MIDYKKLGFKNFRLAKFSQAQMYFSLAYESNKDKDMLFFVQLCSLAQHNPDEARVLFEFYISNNKFNKNGEEFDEILEDLESNFKDNLELEEENAISYEDFMRAVSREGSFKKVFESIMFSTKVMINNRDDFLKFLENLIKNGFFEIGENYLEGAGVIFSGDERINALWQELKKRKKDENLR